LRATQDDKTVSIFAGERKLLEYQVQPTPYKPYVKTLFSPAGVQVLRDSPQDHKHHHALMFALAADKVDFWSEEEGCGRQVPRSPGKVETSVRDGLGRASFTQQLDWIDPRSQKPLLVERRTIDVCRAKDLPATLLTWQTRLEPAAGKESVELSGSHYFGLGLRFVESMDKGGRFIYPEKAGEIVRGSERLTAAEWCAYSATADGKPVTVAMFGFPASPRHPPRMFTMDDPFAYLAATLNLWKEPLVLKAGKPLDLRYGVAVWDGEVDAAAIAQVYRKWVEV
jgi:hypothetical protein